MAIEFKRATKHAAKLRLAFVGPSGSGKTYSALSVATGLGGSIALIDSERGSASKYADEFEFDALELESFSPEMYVRAIHAAEAAGYDNIVVDSLSHAWIGKDGALAMVDDHARREKGNSFGAWRHVTPKHNAMVDALTACKAHLIVTMRSKTEWVIEKDERTGKQVPRKIGLAPVQRDGLEYEFDVVGDLDGENVYTVTKTRCSKLAGKVIEKPGAQLAEVLRVWLDGAPRTEPAPAPAAAAQSQPAGEEDDFEARLRGCTSAQEMGALVTELQQMADGERKDRLRSVYAEVRAARRAGGAA